MLSWDKEAGHQQGKQDQDVETLENAAALKSSLQQVAHPEARNGMEVDNVWERRQRCQHRGKMPGWVAHERAGTGKAG